MKHLLSKVAISKLELIGCTTRYMHKILHSTKTQENIIRNLQHLTLCWTLDPPTINKDPSPSNVHHITGCGKQIHLNRFVNLKTLAVKNYQVDAISTRNQNLGVENIHILTSQPLKEMSNFVHKFNSPNRKINIYIGDSVDAHLFDPNDLRKRKDGERVDGFLLHAWAQ